MRSSHISLFIAFLLSSISLFAQVPQSINYQAMAFDGIAVYANQTFDIRFTLHLNNTTIYEETHFATTSNSQGLFVLKIGQGVPSSGTFAGIDWSGGPYSLKTELNPGSGYVLISDHSFSSVPYALFAERSSLPVEDEFSFNGDTLQLAQNGATLGQVLKWSNTANSWVPANDSSQEYGLQLIGNTLTLVPGGSIGSVSLGTQYNAGPGINIVGGTIVNTGDLDPNDDITINTAAGGDLSGFYPNPVVTGLNGFPFANTIPIVGQVYKWNGTQWIPTADEVDDADSDPINEIQSLAMTGSVLSISGANAVQLPVYLQGPGIDITNNIISSTGDLDPTDDVTISTAAAGDVSGTFPALTVDGLQGNPVSNVTPNIGQVLRWDGTQWIPGANGSGPWAETGDTVSYDGNFVLQNALGLPRVSAGINANNRGYVNVYDEFNIIRAGIQINASGQGVVFGDVKNFRMEHPEDPTKEIWYTSLEGPEAGAYARGTAELVNGNAVISFPDHFQLIATADNMTIMLTPLSGDSEGLAVIEKTTNGFIVKELRKGTGNYRFDWEAKCIRQGYENFDVIRDRK